jgi:hypothetical protein
LVVNKIESEIEDENTAGKVTVPDRAASVAPCTAIPISAFFRAYENRKKKEDGKVL